jgi:serine/threonine-protein kinase
MPPRIRSIFGELSRRHVFRVAGVYAAVAFVVFQAADLIFSALELPEWAFQVVVIGGILGAPIALVLAWAYDLTPQGVVRTDPVIEPARPAGASAGVTAAAGRDGTSAAPLTAIAVLPFANLSGDPESDYFSDGITDDVITGLCKVPGLKVISRTSVMQYRNAARNIREIAGELRVGSVLEGSVRRAGERVRITGQLIDARTDEHLWAEAFDRKLEDVFAIQSEVARQIASALRAELTPAVGERLSAPPTHSMEAYDLYLRGRHLWNRRTPEDLRKSVGYFQRALAVDPKFALASAGLADAWVILGIYGAEVPQEAMRRAREAADEALATDPIAAEALAARACVRACYDWDWGAAEREFRNAIRVAPMYGTAHQWFAMHCLTPLGRFEEALRQLQVASEIDPLSPAVRASQGVVRYFAGRPEAAAAEYRGVLEMHPEFTLARYFLGQALEAQGRTDEAVATFREVAELSSRSPEVVAALGHALGRAGDRREAEALLAELHARAERAYVSPVLTAQVHVGLGDAAGALSELARARTWKAADLIWLAVRPVFAPLRSEPAWRPLLSSIGLPVT